MSTSPPYYRKVVHPSEAGKCSSTSSFRLKVCCRRAPRLSLDASVSGIRNGRFTSHRSDAVKVVRFGLKPQTDAAVASKPPKTDVLRANFYTDALDPVFVIAIFASAIHPLITGRCKNHSAIAPPHE